MPTVIKPAEYLAEAQQNDIETPIAAVAYVRKKFGVTIAGSEARSLWKKAGLIAAGKRIKIKTESTEPPFEADAPKKKKKRTPEQSNLVKKKKRPVESDAPKKKKKKRPVEADDVDLSIDDLNETPSTLSFDSKTPIYGVLSDYFPAAIRLKLEDGTQHFFCSAMCAFRYFTCAEDNINKEKLRTCLDPSKVAYFGSKRADYESNDMSEAEQLKLLGRIMKAKFSQNIAMREVLLSHPGEFLYVNKFDEFLASGKAGTGKNAIGKMLGRLRNYFQKNIT